jgi:putative SOS response-associated peptidase YedK
MCYYISITPGQTDIEKVFGALFTQPESYRHVYSASAFSYPLMPIISNENPQAIDFYQWGLITFWVRDIETANKIRQRTLNARSETIFEKPSFRNSILSKRCLVLADGFFEWRHNNKKKYPYYITLEGHTPFAIAGIWDAWMNPETMQEVRTFSVITTAANPLLEKVHNTRKRMPVILPEERQKRWLSPDLDKAGIASMLTPYDEKGMEAYTVANVINRRGFNTEDSGVLAQVEYPDLPDLDETK